MENLKLLISKFKINNKKLFFVFIILIAFSFTGFIYYSFQKINSFSFKGLFKTYENSKEVEKKILLIDNKIKAIKLKGKAKKISNYAVLFLEKNPSISDLIPIVLSKRTAYIIIPENRNVVLKKNQLLFQIEINNNPSNKYIFVNNNKTITILKKEIR